MAKFLGVPTSGSQGATTWARNRYGQYTRMRAHPVNPNTPAQRQARSALSGCASAWRELTAAQQIAWNEFGKTQRRKGPLGQEPEAQEKERAQIRAEEEAKEKDSANAPAAKSESK